MEWSKLKNVILLMLLCVNAILLLLVGSQASQDRRYQAETRQAAAPRLSEGELQRAADKIYRIIEDRIRQERRRLGL